MTGKVDFCRVVAPLRQIFSPQSIKVHDSGAPLPVYYRSSGPGYWRSVLYQRLNVKRSLLMNLELVLCWEAAWYNICHNTARHRHTGRQKERGNRCLLLHQKQILPHSQVSSFFCFRSVLFAVILQWSLFIRLVPHRFAGFNMHFEIPRSHLTLLFPPSWHRVGYMCLWGFFFSLSGVSGLPFSHVFPEVFCWKWGQGSISLRIAACSRSLLPLSWFISILIAPTYLPT